MENHTNIQMAQIEGVLIDIQDPLDVPLEQRLADTLETSMRSSQPSHSVSDSISEANSSMDKMEEKEIIRDTVAISLKERVVALPGEARESEPFTIFRVPTVVRERNKIHYEPQVVSIGPYYHGRTSLRAMEEHKLRYLRDFLSRNQDISIEDYLTEMRDLETRARRCYSESVKLKSNEFVEMLLLDGCFIIEHIFKLQEGDRDALRDVSWVSENITSDLLLVENQIPFFVIDRLVSTFLDPSRDGGEKYNLVNAMATWADGNPLMNLKLTQLEVPSCEIDHVLHVYYEVYVPKRCPYQSNSNNVSRCSRIRQFICFLNSRLLLRPEQEDHSQNSTIKPPPYVIPSASELCEAGVTFVKKQSPQDLFDITFENGVLEIPQLCISYLEKILFLNLLAFESIKNDCDLLTSYSLFLSLLVKKGKDAAILQDCSIINNLDFGEEDLAVFFNHAGDLNPINFEDHHFGNLFTDIKDYYDRSWHKYKAKLKRDYFSSPWSIISVVAAVILLILTAVQTFFAFYPYTHH